jgi:uncharacterized membrane protein
MDKINQKRIIEFDIARGVAIFLMILQHVWLLIFSRFFDNVFLDHLFFNLGTVLAAPVFLFLMGTSIFLSKKNSPQTLAARGVKLFFVGYLFSALRFFIPLLLVSHFGLIINPEKIIYHFPIIYYLLEIDILQLAGLSLIVLAWFKNINLPYRHYLIIALLIFLFSPLIKILNFDYGFLSYIIDPLWGNSDYVIFPLFPWLAYSLIGYYFGNFFLKANDKELFYKQCLKTSLPVLLLGLLLFIINPNFSYYHHSIGSGLIFSAIVISWISFIGLNWQKIPVKIVSTLSNWSKNVTLIYLVQWLIIAWLAIILHIIY